MVNFKPLSTTSAIRHESPHAKDGEVERKEKKLKKKIIIEGEQKQIKIRRDKRLRVNTGRIIAVLYPMEENKCYYCFQRASPAAATILKIERESSKSKITTTTTATTTEREVKGEEKEEEGDEEKKETATEESDSRGRSGF